MSVFDEIQKAASVDSLMEYYKRAAELAEYEAKFKAATASKEFDIAEQRHRRTQILNRPCMLLGVRIERAPGGGYLAVFDDLEIHGDTPEMAYDNFDHVWTQGERNVDPPTS